MVWHGDPQTMATHPRHQCKGHLKKKTWGSVENMDPETKGNGRDTRGKMTETKIWFPIGGLEPNRWFGGVPALPIDPLSQSFKSQATHLNH